MLRPNPFLVACMGLPAILQWYSYCRHPCWHTGEAAGTCCQVLRPAQAPVGLPWLAQYRLGLKVLGKESSLWCAESEPCRPPEAMFKPELSDPSPTGNHNATGY